MAMIDENVERVRRAADALLKKHGGFEGWFKHLQAVGRRREAAQKRTTKVAARKKRAQPLKSK